MSEYICPHCGNPIYDDDALLCMYCGESLKRDVGVFGKIKYTKPKIIIMTVVGLIVLSFVLLVIF
ncbi:MAG: zinc-ribbon domain-containing protein [Candidatus Omnitrophica bacterium]|nr:zinc-ribbon domain-containing protein [Candidatus Omnitrophota bacterium]